MAKQSSLHRVLVGSSIYFIANLLTKALSFLLLPVYTRYLTPEDYGIIGLSQAFIQLLLTATQLGLLDAVARLYFRYYHDSDKLRSYLTSVMAILAAFSLCVSLGMTVAHKPLSMAIFNRPGLDAYLLLVLWAVPLTQIIELSQAVLVASERPIAFSTIYSGRLFATEFFSILFIVIMRQGAWGSLKADLFAATLIAMVALALFRRYFAPAFNRAYVGESLRFGLPLVPGLLSGWILSYANRIFLIRYGALSNVGLYTVGYTFSSLMSLFVVSVTQAWNPFFYKSMEERTPESERLVVQSTTLLVAVFTAVAFALSLFSREIVMIMAASQYHAAYVVVPILVTYYFLGGLNQIVVPRLLFVGKTHWISVVAFISMSVTIAASILLIPRLDIVGAALAMALAGVVVLAVNFALAWRYNPLHYEYRAIAKIVGLALALFLISRALPQWDLVPAMLAKSVFTVAFIGGLFSVHTFNTEEIQMLQQIVVALRKRLCLLLMMRAISAPF